MKNGTYTAHEVAVILADVVANGVGCVLKAPHCMDVDCTPCILKWLQQPAE